MRRVGRGAEIKLKFGCPLSTMKRRLTSIWAVVDFFFFLFFFGGGGGEVEESLLMDDPFIENHLFCFIKALVFIF